MKMIVFMILAIALFHGVMGSSEEAPELVVSVSGAPRLSLQHTAAVEIMKSKCGELFPKRLCFPQKILDAKTGKDGVDTLVSVAFQACCYLPGMTTVSSCFVVKGVYRTNPGFMNLGVSQVSAGLSPASCSPLQRLNSLKKGEGVAEAVLRRLDTAESHNSVASGLSRQFSGFQTNSKLLLAKFHGKEFSGYSVKLDVRGKLGTAATKFEDFPLAASVVSNGSRQEVLSLV